MMKQSGPFAVSSVAIKALVALVVLGVVAYNTLVRMSNAGVDVVRQGDATDMPVVLEPSVEARAPDGSVAIPPSEEAPAGQPVEITETPAREVMGSGFDFYVMALSGSPDYCATSGQDDPQQCKMGRRLGFVLHGLWPQNNKGYPSSCSNEKLTQTVKDQFVGLYPSAKLYDHEWEKHGTCSGLTPEQYLAFSKRLKDGLVIPQKYRMPDQPVRVTGQTMEQEMAAANPGFDQRSFAVFCSGSGRYLKEMYVCFALDGSPTSCSAEVDKSAARSCQGADFLVRNVR